MRDTIDFGIDLGTTNSAIAVVENGTTRVIKNNEQSDITPSAVFLRGSGQVYVGRTARDRVEKDPDNAAAEFKLEMGLADAVRHFANAGTSLTPTQLSAEVLKSLRADAAHHCGAAPDAAVITVPAAFALNQNKATTDAATLAGFTTGCPLVQEPTAAAFAYGFHDAGDRGYWLVFDFGGGTFDAAVVSKREGDLRVLNHAGDAWLGGKLIDWAIVERILAPKVAAEFGLTDFTRHNPMWRANFAKLKTAAEEAKIRLSREAATTLPAELQVDGVNREFDHELSRAELDAVAEPFYQRAINLCRTALRDAALDPDDIDRLLLVGGVTLAPGLRERLADPQHGLPIELDTSLDPSTVVARGAAIFASTVRRPEVPSLGPAPGEFTVELTYQPSVTTREPTVAGRLSSWAPVDWTGYSVVLANQDFRTPRLSLNDSGGFMTEVYLEPHSTSRFTVELTDPSGTPCTISPNTLSITHRDVEFGGVQLAHSLGIQLADRKFAPLLRNGATLPTDAREVFQTSSALHRIDTDAVLRIPVVQGERDRGDRNREVGALEIRPRDVRLDLPTGSEVEVIFEVNESSLVTVVADVPLAQAQFEAEIDLDNVRSTPQEELQILLTEAETRLTVLRGTAGTSATAQRLLARLDEEGTVTTAREQVAAAAVDYGAAGGAEERIRDLQASLDDIAEAVGFPALVEELREVLDEASRLTEQHGTTADRTELETLHNRAGDAVAAEDSAAVRVQIERTTRFLVELERRNPDFPMRVFATLRETLQSSGSADPLLREGERALRDGDEAGLQRVNNQLIRLLPKDSRDATIGVVRRS